MEESIYNDLAKVKARIPERIIEITDEIKKVKEQLQIRKNEIAALEQSVQDGTANQKKIDLLPRKKASLQNIIDIQLTPLEDNYARLTNPANISLAYYEEAKKIVDLKVIEFTASKFNDEKAMKKMIEGAIKKNQTEIDEKFENKQPGVVKDIVDSITDADMIYISGITFSEDMKPISVLKYSGIFIQIVSHEPDQEEGRFIIKTAYPKV